MEPPVDSLRQPELPRITLTAARRKGGEPEPRLSDLRNR